MTPKEAALEGSKARLTAILWWTTLKTWSWFIFIKRKVSKFADCDVINLLNLPWFQLLLVLVPTVLFFISNFYSEIFKVRYLLKLILSTIITKVTEMEISDTWEWTRHSLKFYVQHKCEYNIKYLSIYFYVDNKITRDEIMRMLTSDWRDIYSLGDIYKLFSLWQHFVLTDVLDKLCLGLWVVSSILLDKLIIITVVLGVILDTVTNQCQLFNVPQTGVGLGQLEVVLGRLPRAGVLSPQVVELLLNDNLVMKPEAEQR